MTQFLVRFIFAAVVVGIAYFIFYMFVGRKDDRNKKDSRKKADDG